PSGRSWTETGSCCTTDFWAPRSGPRREHFSPHRPPAERVVFRTPAGRDLVDDAEPSTCALHLLGLAQPRNGLGSLINDGDPGDGVPDLADVDRDQPTGQARDGMTYGVGNQFADREEHVVHVAMSGVHQDSADTVSSH